MGPVNPRHEKVNRKETARPRIDAMSELSAILEILNDEKDEPEENRDPETQFQRTCLAALDGGHAQRYGQAAAEQDHGVDRPQGDVQFPVIPRKILDEEAAENGIRGEQPTEEEDLREQEDPHAHLRCLKSGKLLDPCSVFHPRSFLPCSAEVRLSPDPHSARWSLDVVKRCQMLGGRPPPLPGGAPVPVEQPAGDGTDNDIRHRDEKKEARVEAPPCIGAHRRTPTDGTRVPRRRDQQQRCHPHSEGPTPTHHAHALPHTILLWAQLKYTKVKSNGHRATTKYQYIPQRVRATCRVAENRCALAPAKTINSQSTAPNTGSPWIPMRV